MYDIMYAEKNCNKLQNASLFRESSKPKLVQCTYIRKIIRTKYNKNRFIQQQAETNITRTIRKIITEHNQNIIRK